jgi:hypothetical protein
MTRNNVKVKAIVGVSVLVAIMVASVLMLSYLPASTVDADPVAQAEFTEKEDSVSIAIDKQVRIDSVIVETEYSEGEQDRTVVDTTGGTETVSVPVPEDSDPTHITVFGKNGSNTRLLQSYTVQDREILTEPATPEQRQGTAQTDIQNDDD